MEQKSSKRLWPIALVVVCVLGFAALVAYGISLAAKRGQEHDANKAQMRAAIDSINDSLSDKPSHTGPAGASGPTAAPANETNEQAVARVMSDVARMIAEGSRKGSDLQGRFATLPLEQVFAPDTLVSKPEIGKARDTLLKANVLIGEYEATFQDYFAKAEGLLRTLPEPERTQGLRSFHTSSDPSISLTRTYVATERDIIRVGNEMLDLAESQLGNTQAQGGSIMFRDEAALRKFQGLQQELMAAAQKEQQIVSQMQQLRLKAQSDMNALRSTVERQ